MPDYNQQILTAVARATYVPLKPKSLARKLNVPSRQYGDFRRALRELLKQGRVEIGKNHAVRPARPHGTVTGIYRRTSTGTGYVRPHLVDGHAGPEVMIREDDALDAATGDEVLVRIVRKPNRAGFNPAGWIAWGGLLVILVVAGKMIFEGAAHVAPVVAPIFA